VELSDHVRVVRCDITIMDDIDTLASLVETEYTVIDLLFVNAGVTAGGSISETSEQTFDELFAVNTKGAFFAAQKLAPLIVAGGAIVLTTSAANAKGLPGTSVYAATKAALRSITRSLARELLQRGKIRRHRKDDRHDNAPVAAAQRFEQPLQARDVLEQAFTAAGTFHPLSEAEVARRFGQHAPVTDDEGPADTRDRRIPERLRDDLGADAVPRDNPNVILAAQRLIAFRHPLVALDVPPRTRATPPCP